MSEAKPLRSVTIGNRDRGYAFYFPPKPQRGLPVVLLFHGGGSNPELILWESGMREAAAKYGHILVTPYGTALDPTKPRALTWNDGRLLDSGQPHPADDASFVDAMLDDLWETWHCDMRRVYLAGYSNGAQLCYRLAHEMPERIAAIGCVAGHRGPNELPAWPRLTKPVNVMQFSGMKDTLAPYLGGAPSIDDAFQTTLKSVYGTTLRWHEHNLCQHWNGSESARVRRDAWSMGTERSEVVLYTLKDGGHTWPGGSVGPSLAGVLGNVNRDVDASDEMFRFFLRHQLKG